MIVASDTSPLTSLAAIGHFELCGRSISSRPTSFSSMRKKAVTQRAALAFVLWEF